MKKRADGRYRKAITDPRTGKRVYFYGNTEREVNKKIFEYNEKAEHGKLFAEVADEWWRVEVECLEPSTIRGYRKATERAVEEFGDIPITDIHTADIIKYLYRLGKVEQYAKKTVKNHKIVVNRIFSFAVVQKEIQYNPAREATIPRGLKSTPRLPATPIEEHKIATTQEVWLLPFMALYTGMRKGELRGLKWKDIDMNRKLIKVERSVWDGNGAKLKKTKTEAGERIIPIPDALYTELKKYKGNPEHYVFGGETPISEKKYRLMYAKFQADTGVKATAQQLRKSYATMAVGAKLDPDVLKTIFGHEDISTTLNIYAQVREERIIAAAEQLNAVKL